MVTVVVDARIDSHTGMGRYMRCTAAALIRYAPPEYRFEVLHRTKTPRYTDAEDAELLAVARDVRADIIHALDYRVPLDAFDVPIIATVHDVMRILRPEYCDTDPDFERRFGLAVFGELRARTEKLRKLTALPTGLFRDPESVYEEHYARMLAYSCGRAAAIVTPTRTVAHQLAVAVGPNENIATSPWGIDHATVEPHSADASAGRAEFTPPAAYLLYVGQARPHKGLATLIESYRRSRAIRTGVTLACVGRDFDVGKHGATMLDRELGDHARCVGSIDDDILHDVYAGARALVHLAEHEGFGFPPLEALAAGCPVIAADIPVLHETLGEHAIYVDHGDPAAAAAAIDDVLACRPDATAATTAWTDRFTWQRHAADLLALYDRVLAR